MENRALLLGRDPNFAWALKKIMENLGYSLEHVYTLPEAKFRMERSSYALFILDGLREEEIESFLLMKAPEDKVIIFDFLPPGFPTDNITILSKAAPLLTLVESLKKRLF
jgi:hypothetical protein